MPFNFEQMSSATPSGMPAAFNSYKPRHMKVYGAICVDSNGNVLLVRGRRSQKWSFPKGHCKHTETDLECARRELKEETGIDAPAKFVSVHKLRGGTYFVFALEQVPTITIRDHWEIEEAAWWPLTELPRLDSNVDVSIFRTLMRSMRGEPADALEFLESPRAHQKVNHIKHCIDAATPSSPAISSLPGNIPISTGTC
jgi:ADP-ribose pyrophosphatase YjhB (NUDIX family)